MKIGGGAYSALRARPQSDWGDETGGPTEPSTRLPASRLDPEAPAAEVIGQNKVCVFLSARKMLIVKRREHT